MKPTKINGATKVYKAPENWDAERDGPCVDLYVRVEAGEMKHHPSKCYSTWKPTAEEIVKLMAGAEVTLVVVGGQPPVALYVE